MANESLKYYSSVGVVEMLPSLLDFRPEAYGLPPFEDRVAGAVLLEPLWRMKGTVVKGFGRGSKVRAGARSLHDIPTSCRIGGLTDCRDLMVPLNLSPGALSPVRLKNPVM